MLNQQPQSVPTDTITVISDLRASHTFLAANEYSPDTIGIHSCLVRYDQNEHFAKNIYKGKKKSLRTSGDFIAQLNDMENKLKDNVQLDVERCLIISRLRKYLENDKSSIQNDKSFSNIIKKIENHLERCMKEDLPLSSVKTWDEFNLQCIERNEAAVECDQAYRRRRFQFDDCDNAKQPINVINLKNWIESHFQLFLENIKPYSPIHDNLIKNLKTLLDNSFLIIQHPSPPIAAHSPTSKGVVTAKLDCRILCLLDRSNPTVTIDNITPYVCRLPTLNHTEEHSVSYQQSPMLWKYYTITTASGGTQKTFSCADLIEIVLDETSAVPQNNQLSTGKIHYAPFTYLHFPNGPPSFQHCLIVQSAPFGLITHTSQEAALFAEVFLLDLKSWKQKSTLSLTTVSNIATSPPPTITNLTIETIVESIKYYFIHKTGIQPKNWVMPYIKQELKAVTENSQDSIENCCLKLLAKILSQIDYLAEHPLLILFHYDGLFLAICDSNIVDNILKTQREYCQASLYAMRFGSIHNMSDAKRTGVRFGHIDKSFPNVRNYTFDTGKLSSELGLFIIKTALCKTSCSENILSGITIIDEQQCQVVFTNMSQFVELYDSEKLRKLCPHDTEYPSIWSGFHNKENNQADDSDSSQNTTTTRTTGGIVNNNSAYNSNSYEQQLLQQRQQYEQQISNLKHFYQQKLIEQQQYYQRQRQQYEQELIQLYNSPQLQQRFYSQPQEQQYGNFSDLTQSSTTSSYNSQINQQYTNSAPAVIAIMPNNQFSMSNQDITQLISNHLPQYSSSIQPNQISRINVDPLSQQFNTPAQTMEDFFSNS